MHSSWGIRLLAICSAFCLVGASGTSARGQRAEEVTAEQAKEGTAEQAKSGVGAARGPSQSPLAGARSVRQAESQGRAFAATGRGLLASDDHGSSWTPVRIGPREEEVYSVAIARLRPGTVWVGRRDGLWKSVNGGSVWSAVPPPVDGIFAPLALAIAESSPDVVYLATARHGIFRSPDGGQRWEDITRGLDKAGGSSEPEEFHSLAVHPSNPDLVYVAADSGNLYRTADSGRRWEALSRPAAGLRPASPLHTPRMAFDPDNPGLLYVVVGMRMHSHLVRNRLFTVTSEGEWYPVAASLPENVAVLDLVAVPGGQGLSLWTEQGAWEIPLVPVSKGRALLPGEPK